MTDRHLARAFGLTWRADMPLSLFTPMPGDGASADVVVERVDALPPRTGGQEINNGMVFADGTRFRFGDATFDMIDGRHVRWTGALADDMPLAFYGTVAGLLLAWRGLVPLHGSAVAIDGTGVLIAGRSGAGKSTLCHALTECGARLVSDDLSAMPPLAHDDAPSLLPGRRGIRLVAPDSESELDKRVVAPEAVPQDGAIRFAHLVLLQDTPVAPGPAAATQALTRQQFRPHWMRVLPGVAARRATLFLAAQRMAIHVLPTAKAAPDVTPAAKAAMVAALLREQTPMDMGDGTP